MHRTATPDATPRCGFTREFDELVVSYLVVELIPETELTDPRVPKCAIAYFFAHTVDFVLCECRCAAYCHTDTPVHIREHICSTCRYKSKRITVECHRRAQSSR